MVRIQIVGATGYGGLGMIELALRHPQLEIGSLLAKSDVGRPVSDFFPHLRGFCDQPVEDASPERIGEGADLVVFATPDGIAMQHARRLQQAGVAVLDYSGDFRFPDAGAYGEYARRHPAGTRVHACPELLPQAIYGIPELRRAGLRGARLVGNPGCFAVGMILGLAPAVRERLVDPGSLICDGKTGISGAGKKPSATHHFPDRNENLTPYRLANHQHLVETSATLAALGGAPVGLTFVPHLLPVTRGILCTMYATLEAATSIERIHAAYHAAYAGEPFVRVLPLGTAASLKAVTGSNVCDLSVAVDAENGRLIVVAAIDNLLKGQAGNAVQNINLMFGFPETLGLERLPAYP
jgi:N-acetyl-gamma-glutamyl-phosphate reductase